MMNDKPHVEFNGETLVYNEREDRWECGELHAPSLRALKYKITKSVESIAKHLPLRKVLIDYHGMKIGEITSVNEAHVECSFVDEEDEKRERVKYYSGAEFYEPDEKLEMLVDEYLTNAYTIKSLAEDNAKLLKTAKEMYSGETLKDLIQRYSIPSEDK